jgi:hypothetical protein
MNTQLTIDYRCLTPIPPAQRDTAVQALKAGDIPTFFNTARSEYGLPLLWFNAKYFQQIGLYEQALLYAFTATRTNNYSPEEELDIMFHWADRKRLRDAGPPLPGTGPFTLYRGVAGIGRYRKVYGYSWTPSLENAQWFADRARACYSLSKPGVYRIEATEDDVLAYINDGQQEQFIVHPGNVRKPQLVSTWEDRSWKAIAPRVKLQRKANRSQENEMLMQARRLG